MNRLIVKYGTPVTIVILAVFSWVIYRRIADDGVGAIVLLVSVAAGVWLIGSFVFIYFWPRITVGGFKRIFLRRGIGGGPIPVNTLYTARESPSQSASAGSVLATGTDDVLYLGGWLDVRRAPQLLHVPEMAGRYYSVQFTDERSGANFAYVGKRTTGTRAGVFFLCARGWSGTTPPGTTRIDLPHGTALLIGRVFVSDDADQPTAYALAEQIRVTAFDR